MPLSLLYIMMSIAVISVMYNMTLMPLSLVEMKCEKLSSCLRKR